MIVISAKLDAASMFEGLAHGADSAGTGISTLLAVLKHLSQPELKNLLSNSSTVRRLINNLNNFCNVHTLFKSRLTTYILSCSMEKHLATLVSNFILLLAT